jgi:hypothetical protein
MRQRFHKIVIGSVMFCAVMFVGATGLSGGGGQIRHVPADYPTIQSGVGAANAGDTVLVAAGFYSENVVVSRSGVRLLGAGDVVLDGTGRTGIGIHVLGTAAARVTDVDISNFEIRNYERGITLELATEVRVSHNYLHDNRSIAPFVAGEGFGIELANVSASDVSHNIISGNGIGGIRLHGAPFGNTDNKVHHNHILDNGAQASATAGSGIFLTGASNDNRIEHNEITGILGWGIVLTRPANGDPIRGMLIAHNRAHHNRRAGIAIMGAATGNTVVYNDARENNLSGLGPCFQCNLFDFSTGGIAGNFWDKNHGTFNGTDACRP